jgi:hypothetical protein
MSSEILIAVYRWKSDTEQTAYAPSLFGERGYPTSLVG